MTWPRVYTPEMDERIIAAIEGGIVGWDELGRSLGLDGNLARQRVDRGLRRYDLIEIMRIRRIEAFTRSVSATRTRTEPLPAGHPLTWGRMLAGTVLDGLPFEEAL